MDQRLVTLDSEESTGVIGALITDDEQKTDTELGAATEDLEARTAELLATLEREAKKRRRLTILLTGALATYVAVMIVVAAVAHNAQALSYIGSISGVFATIGMVTSRARRAATELAELGDVRALPVLLEAIEHTSWRERTKIRTAIERLLPRVRASDSSIIGARQLTLLHRLLSGGCWRRRGRTVQFQINVLRALEQVGNETSATVVRSLIENSSTAAVVRAAAEECLPALQARLEERVASGELLRAAHIPAADPEVLVRAAAPSGHSAPEMLLRPAEAERP